MFFSTMSWIYSNKDDEFPRTLICSSIINKESRTISLHRTIFFECFSSYQLHHTATEERGKSKKKIRHHQQQQQQHSTLCLILQWYLFVQNECPRRHSWPWNSLPWTPMVDNAKRISVSFAAKWVELNDLNWAIYSLLSGLQSQIRFKDPPSYSYGVQAITMSNLLSSIQWSIQSETNTFDFIPRLPRRRHQWQHCCFIVNGFK